MTSTWKALNGTHIPHCMLQGPGVIAEKGAKSRESQRQGTNIAKKMFSDYNRQITVMENAWTRLVKNQTSQNPGLELGVELDDF